MGVFLRRSRKFIILLLVFTGLYHPVLLRAEYLQFGPDIFINMPASWYVEEVGENKFSAANRAGEAFLLVKYTSGDEFDKVSEMYSHYSSGLQAEIISRSAFLFSGNSAETGIIRFPYNGISHTGYLLCVETHRVHVVVLGFCPEESFQDYQDMLLSAIDSLALGESGLMAPGPISQYISPYPEADRRMYSLRYKDADLPVSLSSGALEASQELIEREARVLVVYAGTPYAEEAWQRYYRIIYRDLYRRSRPIYSALRNYLSPEKMTEREITENLLQWVQGFTYKRLDSVSDCLTPIRGAVENTGDCDSRGLLLTIMLHYYGIDAILMVSGMYGHSMVGVDIPGNGARFAHNGKSYLLAETTDQVSLGMIDMNMANPAGWLGIDFLNTRIQTE